MTSKEKAENAQRQFVSFYIGNEKYAIPVEYVREIVRGASVTKIPLTPEHVEGLMNLRGEVVPIINLRKLLGFKEESLSAVRVVVISYQDKSFGLLVDKTAQVIEAGGDDIKSTGAKSEFVEAAIEKGAEFFLIVDVSKILESATDGKETNYKGASEKYGKERKGTAEKTSKFVQLVTFLVNGQLYAFKINSVQEIIRFREVTRVPGSEEYIRGVIKLRESVIPVVDLKMLLFGEVSKTSELTKIVVTKLDNVLVGFIIDKISEVLKVEEDHLIPVPRIGTLSNKEELAGIINLQDKMIMVLDPVKLVSAEVSTLCESSEVQLETRQVVDEVQFVVFKVCDTYFGVPIDDVQEVNRLSKITKLPNAPEFVEGLMNLRGEVLPVVNLKVRLGMCEKSERLSSSSRVLVQEFRSGQKVAYIVDIVDGVEKFPKSLIEDASGTWFETSKVVSKVIKHPEKTILVLDMTKLLQDQDLNGISASIKNIRGDISTNRDSEIPEPSELPTSKPIDDNSKEQRKTKLKRLK